MIGAEHASERELALTANARRKAFHRAIEAKAAALRKMPSPAPVPPVHAQQEHVPPEAAPALLPAAVKEPWFHIVDSASCPLTIRQIQEAVCAAWGGDAAGITVGLMISPRKPRHILTPRQVAMYLSKELTLKSLPTIGRAFGGRDHSTILHGVRKIAARLRHEPDLAQAVAMVRLDLEAAR